MLSVLFCPGPHLKAEMTCHIVVLGDFNTKPQWFITKGYILHGKVIDLQEIFRYISRESITGS